MAEIELSQNQVKKLLDGAELEVRHPDIGPAGHNGTVWIAIADDELGLTDVEVLE